MVSKSEIKLVQSLRLKKFRQKYQLFVAEGEKAVRTLLAHKRLDLHHIYAISDWVQDNDTRVNPSIITDTTKEELKKLSLLSTPPSVLAIFKMGDTDGEELSSVSDMIYLDDVQDPGNVGTIIRIADWYGVQLVARSEGSADFYNPKVVQATMGSLGHVATMTIAKSELNEALKGFQKIGTGMTPSVNQVVVDADKKCLIIGNEGKGLSDEVSALLDYSIHIQGARSRHADSLNAAVATGILCQLVFAE